MSLRAPLGSALGRGAAKTGVHHWWVQRLTAIALVPLGIWFVVSLLSLPSLGYSAVSAWMSQGWTAVLLILFVLTLAWHSQLGVRVVVEDYVHGAGPKSALLVLVTYLHVIAAAAGVPAAIVRARDHFLAGVTALVEGDGAEHVKIQHLRHELRGCDGVDLRCAGAHLEQPPGLAGGGGLRRLRRARGYFQPAPARTVGGEHQALPETALRAGRSVRQLGARQYHRVGGLERARLGEAADAPCLRDVADGCLGAQHVPREPLRDGAGELAGQHGQHLPVGEPNQPQQRNDAPLGIVISGEECLLGTEARHVVRQLPLQERQRIGAGDAYGAELIEGDPSEFAMGGHGAF